MNTPSSTSSFESPWHGLAGRSVWLHTLCLVVGCLILLEWFWRLADLKPSCNDSLGLWASEFAIARAHPDAVLLMGDSRVQMGIDPRVVSAAFPSRTVCQLAVPSTSPLPLLKHFARETDFRGDVLCGVNPLFIFEQSRQLEPPIGRRIQQAQTESWIARWEHPLRAWLQARVVLLRSDLSISSVFKTLRQSRNGLSMYLRIREDTW